MVRGALFDASRCRRKDAARSGRSLRAGLGTARFFVQLWCRAPLWHLNACAELYHFRRGYADGAGDETRTRDSLLGRQVLYQLSYPALAVDSVRMAGFEQQPRHRFNRRVCSSCASEPGNAP